MPDVATVRIGPVRVEFDTTRYIRLRVYSPELGRDCYVQLQRLIAYGHGELDSPFVEDDPRHAHHLDQDRWNNHPANLEGRFPEDHGRHHRRGQLESEGSA